MKCYLEHMCQRWTVRWPPVQVYFVNIDNICKTNRRNTLECDEFTWHSFLLNRSSPCTLPYSYSSGFRVFNRILPKHYASQNMMYENKRRDNLLVIQVFWNVFSRFFFTQFRFAKYMTSIIYSHLVSVTLINSSVHVKYLWSQLRLGLS